MIQVTLGTLVLQINNPLQMGGSTNIQVTTSRMQLVSTRLQPTSTRMLQVCTRDQITIPSIPTMKRLVTRTRMCLHCTGILELMELLVLLELWHLPKGSPLPVHTFRTLLFQRYHVINSLGLSYHNYPYDKFSGLYCVDKYSKR